MLILYFFLTLMTGFAIRHKEAEENEKKRL